jgi:hypothetical protein
MVALVIGPWRRTRGGGDREGGGQRVSVAIITIVAGRHDHLLLQFEGIARSARSPDQHVIVAMDDPHIANLCPPSATVLSLPRCDGHLPLAAARNAGAHNAIDRGADVLIFLDVDCIPSPQLIERYETVALRTQDAILSGDVAYLPPAPHDGYVLTELPVLATAHPGRPILDTADERDIGHTLFWSVSFALPTRTWLRIGGFHPRYTGYGGEDTDFAELARSLGIRHLAIGGATAYHQWHPSPDPPLQHLDDILRNGRIFRDRWGWWPMHTWLHRFEQLGLITHDPITDHWERATPLPLARD